MEGSLGSLGHEIKALLSLELHQSAASFVTEMCKITTSKAFKMAEEGTIKIKEPLSCF